MATALDLLMSTNKDVNLLSEESDICTIDAKTRVIFVPSTIVVGGVQSDKNAERIKFSCPKIVGDNLDLSKFSVRINFENVSSVDFNVSIKDQYICDDVAVDGENVTFSWLIGRNAARYMGTVRFIVCAVKTDSDSNISVEWNTAIAEVPVLEGIEIDQPQIGQEEKDVINQLLELTKSTSAEAVQNVNSAKEQAIKDIQSVSQPDTTLTVEGGLAEAKATGEAIGSLKEELDDVVVGNKSVNRAINIVTPFIDPDHYEILTGTIGGVGSYIPINFSVKMNHSYCVVVKTDTNKLYRLGIMRNYAWDEPLLSFSYKDETYFAFADITQENSVLCVLGNNTCTVNWNISVYDITGYERADAINHILGPLNINADNLADAVPKLVEDKCIVCWGDSLTNGDGRASGTKGWVDILADTFTNYKVINKGSSGENIESIMNRQGAVPLYLKPFILPADTTNVMVQFYTTAYASNIQFGNPYDEVKGLGACFLNGDENIPVFVIRDGNDYYIQRAYAGDEIVFDRPVLLESRDNPKYRNSITIIWAGTNNIEPAYNANQIILRQQAMVDYLKTDKYLIIGLTSKARFSDIENINTQIGQKWGRKFLDIRKYILEFGLSDNNITATSQDLSDISNGIIPSSLRADDTHFNEKGYYSIAKCIVAWLKNEKYID